MDIYPYQGRDLFKESHETRSVYKRLFNPIFRNRGATGIFELSKRKMTPLFIEDLIRNHLFPCYGNRLDPIHVENAVKVAQS